MDRNRWFVAPGGDDAGPGSLERPFATAVRARDAARRRSGAAEVIFLAGEYSMDRPLELGVADSGTASGAVVYRALEPGSVTWYGGRRLAGFEPVTDLAVLARLPEDREGKIWQCDLGKLGIEDLGRVERRGYTFKIPETTLEVYSGGRPMRLSRWPKRGFESAGRLLEAGDASGRPSVFEYRSPRHARWSGAKELMLCGYFRYLWSDATVEAAVDASSRRVTVQPPYLYGGRDGMSEEQGIVYYACNLLEELGEPGEYFLDRRTGVLYVDLPEETKVPAVEIGMLKGPMLRIAGAANLTVSGISFDLGRGDGIRIVDSVGVTLENCRVTRFAGDGVAITGGRGCAVRGCEIAMTGRAATRLEGGDRVTLAAGGHVLENCIIHDFGRIDRTYTPAVWTEGVGHRVAGNLMYDAPSSAMRLNGNDHLIENNEVCNVCTESDDQGAVDIFYDPSQRGTRFLHNHFHDIGKMEPGISTAGSAAIRFDDAVSGMVVRENCFERCSGGSFGAIQINSGRDNLIEDNIFSDCRAGVSGGWNPDNAAFCQIRSGQAQMPVYLNELYFREYPELRRAMDPGGTNTLRGNGFFGCLRALAPGSELLRATFILEDNFEVKKSGGDWRELPMASRIPLDRIGCFRSGRKVAAPERRVPEWKPNGEPEWNRTAQIGGRWRIFAPVDPEAAMPLTEMPEGGTEVTAEEGRFDWSECVDAPAERQVAWIYLELTASEAGSYTLGFAADWWMRVWIDGAEVCDTTGTGNAAHPFAGGNHPVQVELAAGRHLLAARCVRGVHSGLFLVADAARLRREWHDEYGWIL